MGPQTKPAPHAGLSLAVAGLGALGNLLAGSPCPGSTPTRH